MRIGIIVKGQMTIKSCIALKAKMELQKNKDQGLVGKEKQEEMY